MKDNRFRNLSSMSLVDVINSDAVEHLKTRFATLESLYVKTRNIANAINWTMGSQLKNLHLEDECKYEQNLNSKWRKRWRRWWGQLPPLQYLTLR